MIELVAMVSVAKCQYDVGMHRFCLRTVVGGHSRCQRHVKVNERACCGRPCTFTIIVLATDIIFVVRYSFKDINYDIVMYTKNAAQTRMDTKARNPGRDQKTRGCALGC